MSDQKNKVHVLSTEQLQFGLEQMIEVLGNVVEYRTFEGDSHSQHIKAYVEIVGRAFLKLYPNNRLTEEDLEIAIIACPLHNIGKVVIPDQILHKQGKLTKDEFDLMKSHTLWGVHMLKGITSLQDSKYAKICEEICRSHHERYDGSGYPDGLKGPEIPVYAELVGLADVYDALINDTPYRGAYTKDEAFMMIVSGECGIFSPKIMEAFTISRDELEKVQTDDKQEY